MGYGRPTISRSETVEAMRRMLTMQAAQIMLLDGSQGETFNIPCPYSVINILMTNVVPGQLYAFIVTENKTGNHQFNWGSQIINGMPIQTTPNAQTVQCYIGLPGNLLYAIMPGTWTQETP